MKTSSDVIHRDITVDEDIRVKSGKREPGFLMYLWNDILWGFCFFESYESPIS